MHGDVLSILAEECCPMEQLDPEAAWDEIQRARALPMDSDAQFAYRNEALNNARIKFKMAQEVRKQFKQQEAPGQD